MVLIWFLVVQLKAKCIMQIQRFWFQFLQTTEWHVYSKYISNEHLFHSIRCYRNATVIKRINYWTCHWRTFTVGPIFPYERHFVSYVICKYIIPSRKICLLSTSLENGDGNETKSFRSAVRNTLSLKQMHIDLIGSVIKIKTSHRDFTARFMGHGASLDPSLFPFQTWHPR